MRFLHAVQYASMWGHEDRVATERPIWMQRELRNSSIGAGRVGIVCVCERCVCALAGAILHVVSNNTAFRAQIEKTTFLFHVRFGPPTAGAIRPSHGPATASAPPLRGLVHGLA